MANIVAEGLRVLRRAMSLDSWQNPLTGLGTGRDKTTYNAFQGDNRLPDMLLTDLFNHNGTSRRIVSIFPDEAFREGYDVECDVKGAAEPVLARAAELDLETAFAEGIRWGRLYGGAVLLIGADDGRPSDMPLDPERVRSVTFFDVFDRRRAWPWRYYQDPKHPRFGKPDVYALQSLQGGIAYVHETRLVIFRGAHTDDYTRRLLNGWDFSILQNIYDDIQHFDEVFKASRVMMTDASQGIFKLKGLIGMLSGQQRELLETRAQMLDMGRSIARSIMLDAGTGGNDPGEDFRKEATNFTGVADQLILAAKKLSAVTGIPMMVLLGETPAGLNASGDANVRLWYDSIKSQQKKTICPQLIRCYSLIGRSLGYRGTWTVTPRPLWQETPTETATRRKTVAETDKIYAEIDVLSPEMIRQSRFGPGGWSEETTIAPEDLDKPLPPLPLPDPSGLPGQLPPPNTATGTSPTGPSQSPGMRLGSG